MNNPSIKKTAYHFKTRPALLCLLLSFFLLTDCTIKKSIQGFVDGNNATENTNPNAKRQLVVSSQTCFTSTPSALGEVDSQGTRFAKPVLPVIYLLFSHIRALSFQNQNYSSSPYSSNATALKETPLYLRNRVLLI